MTVTLIVDVMVALLLVTAIGYCAILNRRLQALRADKENLVSVVAGLGDIVGRAEQGIANLKASAEDVGRELQARVEEGRSLRDDLSYMVDRGASIADRLEVNFRAARGEVQSNEMRVADAKRPEPRIVDDTPMASDSYADPIPAPAAAHSPQPAAAGQSDVTARLRELLRRIEPAAPKVAVAEPTVARAEPALRLPAPTLSPAAAPAPVAQAAADTAKADAPMNRTEFQKAALSRAATLARAAVAQTVAAPRRATVRNLVASTEAVAGAQAELTAPTTAGQSGTTATVPTTVPAAAASTPRPVSRPAVAQPTAAQRLAGLVAGPQRGGVAGFPSRAERDLKRAMGGTPRTQG